MNFLGVYVNGVESAFSFSPNLGIVKILLSEKRYLFAHLSVLPEMPMSPSVHMLAENVQPYSS